MNEPVFLHSIVSSLGQPKRRIPARPGLRLGKGIKLESFDVGADQERLQTIVDYVLTLPIGRRLLKETAPYFPQATLDPELQMHGSLRSDQAVSSSLMSLNDKASDDMLATFAVHELAHLKQLINMRRYLGEPNFFRQSARTIADVVVPELLGEADAVANEIAAVFELNQRRVPGPWAFTRFYQPDLATALSDQVAAGHSPRSRETRAAVANAWLVSPLSSRPMYEARFLSKSMENQANRYPALTYAMQGSLPNRGEITHTDFDLCKIARDRNDQSYFELMDLRKLDYLGIAGKVVSMAELTRLARKTISATEIEKLYRQAESIVTLLEDHTYGIFAWAQLPAYFNAASAMHGVVNGSFQNMLNAIGITSGRSRQEQPELKQRAQMLFDRCEAVAKEASLLERPLREAVAAGQKEMAESSSWLITRNLERTAGIFIKIL